MFSYSRISTFNSLRTFIHLPARVTEMPSV